MKFSKVKIISISNWLRLLAFIIFIRQLVKISGQSGVKTSKYGVNIPRAFQAIQSGYRGASYSGSREIGWQRHEPSASHAIPHWNIQGANKSCRNRRLLVKKYINNSYFWQLLLHQLKIIKYFFLYIFFQWIELCGGPDKGMIWVRS